jgi:hypothetical protein
MPSSAPPRPLFSRCLLWLLVLFAAGVLLPFTTSLHNICLSQTAATEIRPLAGLLGLLLGAIFAGELRLARTPLLKPLLACLAVLLLTSLLAEFRYAAAEHIFTTKAPRHQVRPET